MKLSEYVGPQADVDKRPRLTFRCALLTSLFTQVIIPFYRFSPVPVQDHWHLRFATTWWHAHLCFPVTAQVGSRFEIQKRLCYEIFIIGKRPIAPAELNKTSTEIAVMWVLGIAMKVFATQE